jgi:hypothetical protein
MLRSTTHDKEALTLAYALGLRTAARCLTLPQQSATPISADLPAWACIGSPHRAERQRRRHAERLCWRALRAAAADGSAAVGHNYNITDGGLFPQSMLEVLQRLEVEQDGTEVCSRSSLH